MYCSPLSITELSVDVINPTLVLKRTESLIVSISFDLASIGVSQAFILSRMHRMNKIDTREPLRCEPGSPLIRPDPMP